MRSTIWVLLLATTTGVVIGQARPDEAQKSENNFSPVIPKTWEGQAIASVELPLASTGVPPEPIPTDYFYRMAVRPIYKSYPIYAPGKEPPGYFERLKQLEPQIDFDSATLRREPDWIKVGELVFDAPTAHESDDPDPVVTLADVRNPTWYEKVRVALDHTGLVRHRDIGDLMRYAALNTGGEGLSRNAGFRPADLLFGGKLPDPAMLDRHSDEQLYALARYIYSLRPPPNPNKFDALAARGQKVFEREGCAACHTPPLYTNNKLTIAAGFKPPEDHLRRFDILNTSVGTDPNLALRTRRGTGYYKVPSLKGVWYRGPFEHNGSVATLEDWFDPRRLRDDYVPTGFKGYAVKTRAVKGHEFGLKLSSENKAALIGFLKTL